MQSITHSTKRPLRVQYATSLPMTDAEKRQIELQSELNRLIHRYDYGNSNHSATCMCIACERHIPQIGFPPEPRLNRAERRRAEYEKKRRAKKSLTSRRP